MRMIAYFPRIETGDTEMLKRGQKIEYTFAGGKVVQGKIVKPVAINLWDKCGIDLWYQVKLADTDGAFGGTVHHGQVRAL